MLNFEILILLHPFLKPSDDFLKLIPLRLDALQLDAVLALNFQFFLILQLGFSELRLLDLTLFLENLNLLLFHLYFVIELPVLFGCQSLIVLIGHFELLYS